MMLYALGVSAELNDRPADAISHYRRALELDPDAFPILDSLTSLLSRQRRGPEAITLLEAATRRQPELTAAWHRLGRLYSQAERWEPALAAWAQALKQNPDHPELLLGMAVLLEIVGRRAESSPFLRRAFDRGARSLPMLEIAGRIVLDAHRSNRDDPETRDLVRDLAVLSEPGIESHLLAAEIFRRSNREDLAAGILLLAQDRRPPDLNERFQLATAWLRAGRPERAIPILENLAAMDNRGAVTALQLLIVVHRDLAERDTDPGTRIALQEAAVGYLLRLIEQNPEDIPSRMMLADQWLRMGRIADVMRILRDMEPDNPLFRASLGRQLLEADAEPLRDWLGQQAEAGSEDTWVLHTLGEIEAARGRLPEATAWFEAAVRTPHPAVPSFLRCAWISAQSGDLAGADRFLERGLAIHENHPALLDNRSHIAVLLGDAPAAAHWLERVAEALPADSVPGSLRARQAVLRCMAGRNQEALDALDQALREDPLLIQTVTGLLISWARRMEGTDAPRILLDHAMDSYPDNPAMAMSAGLFAFHVGRYEEAIRYFEIGQERARNTGSPEEWLLAPFHFWLGAAFERNGLPDRAEEQFEICIAMDPDHAQALNYVAYMWAERNVNLDRALDYVRRALDLVPGEPAYLDTIGWIFFRLGEPENALEYLLRAAEEQPEDAEILDHVAQVLNHLGRSAEALEYWTRAFLSDPAYGTVRAILEEAGLDMAGLSRQADEAARKKRAMEVSDWEPLGWFDVSEPTSDRPIPGLDLTADELERLTDPLNLDP